MPIDPDFQLLLAKIDTLAAQVLTRQEYADRHGDLKKRVDVLEENQRRFGEYSALEHDKIRRDFVDGDDRLRKEIIKRFDEMSESVDEIKKSMDKSKNWFIQLIISSVVSFVLGGGGLFALLEYMHALTTK